MTIQGVILDVDGTLIDSNAAHAHAWVEAMRDNGYQADYDEIFHMIGMGGDKVLVESIGVEKESDMGQRINQRRQEIFKTKYLPDLKGFPYAKELLLHMRNEGLKLVVASSAQEDELNALLAIIEARDLLNDQTSSDEADQSKPDPDIVEAALKKIGLPPDAVIMLGDTPYDVKAAAQARVQTIAVRCGGWDDTDLQDAAQIFDDPADLLNNYKRSLLARP